MSYTLGEWHVFPRGDDGMLHVGPAEHSIAKVLRVDDEAGNASLLAAAPNLLEACKAAETHYGFMCEVMFADNPPPHSLPVLESLRAAIAKAVQS